MNGIIIENLTIGYKKAIVAEHLSANISSGMLTCLTGRNGLGKSTLLRTIAGLQPPLGGKVTYNIDGKEKNIASLSHSKLSHLVSIVLTEKIDVTNMTVSDIVCMGRMPYTNFLGTITSSDRAIVDKAMMAVGIESFAQRNISSLSDGERQKAMIAMALAQQTPIVILDEPTAFLDYKSKVETMSLLRSLAHDLGKIVVASTHDLDIAIRFADKLLTIGDGIKEVPKEAMREAIEDYRLKNLSVNLRRYIRPTMT